LNCCFSLYMFVSSFKKFISQDEFKELRVVRGGLISSTLLAAFRFIISVYYLLVLILHIIYGPDEPVYYVAYLSFLSFYGINAYLILSTYFSLRYYFDRTYIPWEGQHWIFLFLYSLLYEVCVSLSFTVTSIYWILLAKDDLADISQMGLFLSISYHGFDFIIMIFEVVFANNPLFFNHFIFIFVIVFLYSPYAFLLHAIYGFWSYSFLNYEDNPVVTAVTILSAFIVSLFYYMFMWFVHRLRDRFNSRTKPNAMG